MNAHRLRHGLPFGRPTAIGLGVTVAAMLVWGFLSVFWFALACSVDQWEAWIPAVATTGTMLVASRLAALDYISRKTRIEATVLGAVGVVGDVIITSVQHYMAVISKDPQHVHASPEWGGVVGGIPSLMVACLIHLGWQVYRDHRTTRAAAEQARIEAAHEAERQRQIADEANREADRQRVIAQEQRLAAEQNRLAAEAKARAAQAEAEAARLKLSIEQAELERTRVETTARVEAQADAGRTTDRRTERTTNNGQNPDGQKRRRTTPSDKTSDDAPDIGDLLEDGRQVARDIAARGERLTRERLVDGLKDRGRTCATNRAIALLNVLKAEANTAPPAGRTDRTIEGRSTDRRLTSIPA